MKASISIFEDPKTKINKLWMKEIGQKFPKLDGFSVKTQLWKKSKKTKKWNVKSYALYEDKLAQVIEDPKSDKVVKVVQFVSIANMKLEKVRMQEDLDQKMGFRLKTSEKYCELFAKSKDIMLIWYKELRRYCILSNYDMDYKTYKKLGEGSFAQVFYARKKNRNVEFAVKQFDKSKFQDLEIERKALMKEFEIMRKLHHNNIIKLHQIYEDDKFLYVVVDLLKGGDLLNNITRYGRFNEEAAQKLMYPLLEALVYLHKTHKIMHRDLKPENIILRNKDNIYDITISDFGLADYYNKEGKYLFTRCGTPGYVAPEILRDNPYDFKVDCFSAGIIMFIILTGTSPFRDDDHDMIVDKNLKCNIDFTVRNLDKRVSYDTLDLLKKLLKANPKERISAEDALKHAFFSNVQKPSETSVRLTQENSIDEIDFIEDIPKHDPQNTKKFGLMSRTPLLSHKFETPQVTPSPKFSSYGKQANDNKLPFDQIDGKKVNMMASPSKQDTPSKYETPSNQIVHPSYDQTPEQKIRGKVQSIESKYQNSNVQSKTSTKPINNNDVHSLNELDEFDIEGDFDENPVSDAMAKYNFNENILLCNRRQMNQVQAKQDQEEQKANIPETNKVDQKKKENRANVKEKLKMMENI